MKVKLIKNINYLLLFVIFLACHKESLKEKYLQDSAIYKGKKLYTDMACNACHSIDGSLKLGPSLYNQMGNSILHTDGSEIIIDEEYIKESIIDPLKYIVEGYTPIMPSYKPVLSDEDINNIIAYIKTLSK